VITVTQLDRLRQSPQEFNVKKLGIITQGCQQGNQLRQEVQAGKGCQLLEILPRSTIRITANDYNRHTIELVGDFKVIELDVDWQVTVNASMATFEKIRLRCKGGATVMIDATRNWKEAVEEVPTL
jgi:hypothetical protein